MITTVTRRLLDPRAAAVPPRFRGPDLMREAAAAGVTGRGGAGFPAARKLAAVAAAGGRPVVVANAAEGEPFSAKDRTLLARAPHLVLDGLQLAAEAVGARTGYAYVPAAAAEPLRAALASRAGDRLPVTVHIAPDAFVAGEESAVVAALNGQRPVPTDKLRRVTDRGVGGAPTLVQNVETLAHLALVARHGAAWFREEGTAESPGTFLATVGGTVRDPGVYELPYGVPLADLLGAAGGPATPLGAVLVGGYHGGWVPARDGVTVSCEGLLPYGAAPGAGVVLALPADACGLVESARIAGYLAGESAGRCGPCANGLPRVRDTLGALAARTPDPRLPAEVERLASLVAGRGACAHPDGTARFVRSSLRAFAADVAAHLAGHCVGAWVR